MVLRVAVYAAPRPGTAWHRRSTRWLGYDPVTGATVARTDVLPRDELADLTSTAATYGFHATLRSPFTIADGADVADVLVAVDRVARALSPTAPRLGIDLIGGFAAFVPAHPDEAVAEIERACVVGLDDVVAPPDGAGLARRRAAGLSPRQDELLVRWGYPYVLDEFRLHMTLTRRLDEAEADRVLGAARSHFGALDGAAFPFDDLVVTTQRDGAPFLELTRVPLGGSSLR